MAPTHAMTRIAWHDIRRNKWRSALVAFMIALPIAGLTTFGVVATTISPSPEEEATGELGNANLRISEWEGTASVDEIVSLFPDGTQRVLVDTWDTQTIVGGSVQHISIVDVNPEDPIVGPMYKLIEGRAPDTTDEIVVSPSVLEGFGARVGEYITVADNEEPYRIVGVAVAPEQLNRPIGLVPPGSLSSNPEARLLGLFLALPDDAPQDAWRGPVQGEDHRIHGYLSREMFSFGDGSERTLLGDSLGITAVVLMETGLIVAAAFVVGARRQLRTVGLIGASGGEPRHVRRLMLSTGTLLGLFGSIVGIGVGLGIAIVISPLLDDLSGRITGPLEVPMPILMGGLILGTGAAMLAALQPARTAARVQTLDALAGRSPAPRPPGRLARLGLLAVIVGSAAVGWGTAKGNEEITAIGFFAVVGGFLITIPALVKRLGRIATWFPLPMRIAARDTARHGRRTSAAVAAAVVALAIPVAAATVNLSNEAQDRSSPSLAENHLLIRSDATDGETVDAAAALASDLATGVFPDALVVSFFTARYDPMFYTLPQEFEEGEGIEAETAGAVIEMADGDSAIYSQRIYIGGAELLRALHAEDAIADLERGKAIAFDPLVVDNDVTYFESPEQTGDGQIMREDTGIPVVDASTRNFTPGILPGIVVSPTRAVELGLEPSGTQTVLLVASSAVTDGQLVVARELAAQYPDVYVTGMEDTIFDSTPLRVGAFGFSAVVALAIVAVAVALVAAESCRDQAILTAVGAGPWTRRQVVGSSALLLTAIAALVAVPAGYIPAMIIQATSDQGYPVVVPWLTIFGVTIAVPLVAGLVAAAVSRPPPAAHLLRPIA